MSESNAVVGLQEIADLLEVGKRTPHAWQYRKLLPPADYPSVNGLRAWDRSTIVQWAADTGRLPPALRSEAKDAHIPRGGRRAKAENIAALAAAGQIPVPAPVTAPPAEPETIAPETAAPAAVAPEAVEAPGGAPVPAPV
jgi:hypothetical protein